MQQRHWNEILEWYQLHSNKLSWDWIRSNPPVPQERIYTWYSLAPSARPERWRAWAVRCASSNWNTQIARSVANLQDCTAYANYCIDCVFIPNQQLKIIEVEVVSLSAQMNTSPVLCWRWLPVFESPEWGWSSWTGRSLRKTPLMFKLMFVKPYWKSIWFFTIFQSINMHRNLDE